MKSLDLIRPSSPPAKPSEPKFRLPKVSIPRLRLRRPVAVTAGILIITLGLYLYLPQATITVKARTEPTTRDFEIRVDQNQGASSSADLAVPGRMVEREISGQGQYAATGTRNVGKIASGFVSIYNFSKTTLILKAQTTVLTASGRKYYFTQDVPGIRPTARIGLEPGEEEIDETSLVPPVPLAAEGAGEEYNLPAGTRLEIQNEAFGSQPKLLYAIAGEGITGGTTKIAKFVTEADLRNAYAAVASVLLDQSRAEPGTQNSSWKILDNAYTMQVLDQYSPTAVGTETSEFEAFARVRIRALAFDETDVKKIIFERVSRLLPPEKLLAETPSRFDINFLSLSLDQGSGVLSAHFEGSIVYQLDATELREKVRGKSAEEIREIILSRPEIESLEIEFSPFWVKSTPKLRGKITIDISR